MTKSLFCSGLVLFACAGGVLAEVEQPVPLSVARETESNFAGGSKEFQNVVGAFLFFERADTNRPSVDLAVDSLRLGIMLNDPWPAGLFSGNFEVLGEIFSGPIVEGPGHLTAGVSLLLRYNFIQPRARLVPYLMIGAGGVYTDIGEKESRGLISLPVGFNLQGVGGTRIVLNDRWSLVIEAGYRHISNAEIKKPNFGIDSVGGNLGFGFFF
ncbi:MAG: acyloxyacyl hydrolase [Chthoniobacterales bacterium]